MLLTHALVSSWGSVCDARESKARDSGSLEVSRTAGKISCHSEQKEKQELEGIKIQRKEKTEKEKSIRSREARDWKGNIGDNWKLKQVGFWRLSKSTGK